MTPGVRHRALEVYYYYYYYYYYSVALFSECKRKNVNVNWYYLLQPSRNGHATELFFFFGAMPDDATESVVTHSSKLQPSIICKPQLQPLRSAALVHNFMTLQSRMKVQVSLEITWFSVLYVPQPRTRASPAKGKSFTTMTTVVSYESLS